MTSLINKARRPKFEVHLQIYDLNNVPLVSGASLIKWHIPGLMHGEHRGRTPKCPIANHRVEYNYCKILTVRIAIDKNNCLSESWIEFEVVQEFLMEKITLGTVRLNLSEYVEESDSIARGLGLSGRFSNTEKPLRKRSSVSSGFGGDGSRPTSSARLEQDDRMPHVEDGVVRRYLMQDSKINSTLKISILMVQIDGERSYAAPPLKTAPVFGGIAGFMAAEQGDQDDEGQLPTLAKSHDASEVQDMYRRALAASWASWPDEPSAEEVIEDVFGGGDGWGNYTGSSASSGTEHARRHSSTRGAGVGAGRHQQQRASPRDDSGSASGDEGGLAMGGGTLRQRDLQRLQAQRRGSETSDVGTLTGSVTAGRRDGQLHRLGSPLGGGRSGRSGPDGFHRRGEGSIDGRSRSGSMASLAPTLGSEHGRNGFKRAKEVTEEEAREDLQAWSFTSWAT